MSDDSDDELLSLLRQTFLEEALEFVGDSEVALIAAEDVARRTESLDRIFRAYHSIKGSALTVGYDGVASLAHAAEDCLSVLRAEPGKLDKPSVSLLLEVNDAMRRYFESGEAVEPGSYPTFFESLKVSLHETLESLQKGTATPSGDISEGEPEKAAELKWKATAAEPTAGERDPAAAQGRPPPLKVDGERLDQVMDMVGELVVIKSQLVEMLRTPSSEDGRTDFLVNQFDKIVRELHEKTLSMRMLSLKPTFAKMRRAARDLSVSLEKPVDFQTRGEDTELDRVLIGRVADPLMHLCRNAIDHGLEDVPTRVANGKPGTGSLDLRAYRRGDTVVIEVRDDGRGLDRIRILEKAVQNGMLSPGVDPQALSDSEVFDLIFLPGFSTAAKVTDVSGRGVGLDVVKANLSEIKGRIEVESQKGLGTVFRMTIPLTTAITDGIVVRIDQQRYILPIDCVRNFIEPRNAEIRDLMGGGSIVKIEENVFPLISLAGMRDGHPTTEGLIVLAEALGEPFAFMADEVVGKSQVVLKSLNHGCGSTDGFAGAAVLGDGTVALVFDTIGLVAQATAANRDAFRRSA